MASSDLRLFPDLVSAMWSEDGLVRMRAADAVEKITRIKPELLQPYKKELLGLMAETEQQEVRWHLAVMVPRFALSDRERRLAALHLTNYLQDKSSIVKTFALQGLADLAQNDSKLQARVLEILREATRTGTAAMKARARKLLMRFES